MYCFYFCGNVRFEGKLLGKTEEGFVVNSVVNLYCDESKIILKDFLWGKIIIPIYRLALSLNYFSPTLQVN